MVHKRVPQARMFQPFDSFANERLDQQPLGLLGRDAACLR